MKVKVSEDNNEARAIIKVIGVGGAGGNAINRMCEVGMHGVELIAANSDNQTLRDNQAEMKIQLGEALTKGLGVGGDSMRGRMAALESQDEVREVLQGADLVFVTTGMGGGTGTGGAPVVASIAKELGALTIGVVTRPFAYEGLVKANIAEQGIQEMRKNVDVLLIIPNEKLFEITDKTTSFEAAFHMVDDVLRRAIQSISDVITVPGIVNMDLNDLRAIMKDAGDALIGMAEESGEDRAERAAKGAVESPLLENVVIDGAKGLIVNITGRRERLTLAEIEEITGVISSRASPEAKIKVGTAYDEAIGEGLRVTVIATGFPVRRTFAKGSGRRDLQPQGAPMAPGASGPDEWLKPAFMRFKVRKLK
jgi:cell division protein FtsZ